jgi:predicted secreted protein
MDRDGGRLLRHVFVAGSVLLAGLAAHAAFAGDAAARRVIGFSPDGAYFAFEQYGTLDWSDTSSGYSEIAIIDTRTDEFYGGKTIRVVDESGDATLTVDQARKQAAAQAKPILAKLGIARRGERIAVDRFTFPDDMVAYNDINRLEAASLPWISTPFDELGVSTVELEPILADSATDCSTSFDDKSPAGDKAGKALGFRLSLRGQDGKPIKVLHEDKTVPASRNCPTSYGLSEVYELKTNGKATAVAVLVQRFSEGYEGRDRRFMAVTGQVP